MFIRHSVNMSGVYILYSVTFRPLKVCEYARRVMVAFKAKPLIRLLNQILIIYDGDMASFYS